MRAPLIVCLFWHCANSIPKSQFYPFGLEHGDEKLPSGDEGSSPAIDFQFEPFILFQNVHRSAYINLNGLISLDANLRIQENYKNLSHLSYPLVAGFYADIETKSWDLENEHHGQIFYRETNNSSLLERFSEKVLQHFPHPEELLLKGLLVATWDRVGYFSNKYDKVVTFQIVLAMGHLQSYVEFLYADEESAGPKFDFPWSGKPEVINITRESNIGVPGNFLFKVSDDPITAPPIFIANTVSSTSQSTANLNDDLSEAVQFPTQTILPQTLACVNCDDLTLRINNPANSCCKEPKSQSYPSTSLPEIPSKVLSAHMTTTDISASRIFQRKVNEVGGNGSDLAKVGPETLLITSLRANMQNVVDQLGKPPTIANIRKIRTRLELVADDIQTYIDLANSILQNCPTRCTENEND